MRKPWMLSAKLGAVGGILLLLALASIGLTLSVTWQLEGGAAAVNEAGRMRMQAWRLAQSLAVGDAANARAYAQRFDESVALLTTGDPARPLFVPHDAASKQTFAEVRQRWAVIRAAWLDGPVPSPEAAARQAEAFVERIDAFVSAIESRMARWTSVLRVFELAMVALVIASGVALLYAAYLFVFDPLARLQEGLARVEAGDLSARVEVATRDEFGAVAGAFNRMASRLQGLYQHLESRVAEKTEHLRAERERLGALYEASALVARADTLPELARGFARQMRRIAQADAAAVRCVDESDRRYLLAGSDCLPQEIIDAEACVRAGECLCGQAPGTATTRVIPIQVGGASAACARAGFQQVVSVPARLHDRVLAEVDLFYRGTRALGDEDRALLDALAGHLAGALESQRAGALEREAAVANERGLLARELHDSIAQGLAFMKIQVQLLRDALRRGEGARVERTVSELDAGVRESTADVRELLLHFRTRTNAEDIVPALQTTLSKFEHQSGLEAHLQIKGEGLPLPPDVQIQVLHVVQEALSNVRKHALARQVWVELDQSGAFRVEVRDDGRGFAPATAAPAEMQVGLRIMRERAERIGAAVEVCSEPGRGTRVVLTMARGEEPNDAALAA